MKRVLISREAEASASLIRILAERQIEGVPIQVIEARILSPNDFQPDPADFQGVVFTSPRAVEVASDIFTKSQITLPMSLKVFAVGVATAAMVRKRLNRDADLTGASGGAALAEEIIGKFGASISPLLWLAPLETAVDLKSILAEAGIRLEKWVIYETVAIHPSVIEKKLAQIGQFDAAFLTAPSAVNALAQIPWIITKPAAAIGSTTARAMKAAGWQSIAIAKSPAVEDCCGAIVECLSGISPK